MKFLFLKKYRIIQELNKTFQPLRNFKVALRIVGSSYSQIIFGGYVKSSSDIDLQIVFNDQDLDITLEIERIIQNYMDTDNMNVFHHFLDMPDIDICAMKFYYNTLEIGLQCIRSSSLDKICFGKDEDIKFLRSQPTNPIWKGYGFNKLYPTNFTMTRNSDIGLLYIINHRQPPDDFIFYLYHSLLLFGVELIDNIDFVQFKVRFSQYISQMEQAMNKSELSFGYMLDYFDIQTKYFLLMNYFKNFDEETMRQSFRQENQEFLEYLGSINSLIE